MVLENYLSWISPSHLSLLSESVMVQENAPMDKFTIAMLSLAAISTLGCIFNIIMTLALKLHYNALGKMVVILSLYDAIFTISFALVGYFDVPPLFLLGVFIFSWTESIVWVTCFAHALYVSIRYDLDHLNNSLLKKYAIVSTTIGILIVIFEFTRFVLYSGGSPAILALFSIVYCTICYGFVMRKLREYDDRIHLELLLYPLILIICDFPLVLQLTALMFSSEIFPLYIFKVSSACLLARGILNAFAYGLSSKIRQGFKMLCLKKSSNKLLESAVSDPTHYMTRDECIDDGSSNLSNFNVKTSLG